MKNIEKLEAVSETKFKQTAVVPEEPDSVKEFPGRPGRVERWFTATSPRLDALPQRATYEHFVYDTGPGTHCWRQMSSQSSQCVFCGVLFHNRNGNDCEERSPMVMLAKSQRNLS